ncbi:unnamed protein product [Calicophoron daubneyi]|uniref:Sema domain-containing protein n=1 Tax=Calicophoron daubneyi TaxID=300641 RepID=A0AAV2T8T0_CALDB
MTQLYPTLKVEHPNDEPRKVIYRTTSKLVQSAPQNSTVFTITMGSFRSKERVNYCKAGVTLLHGHFLAAYSSEGGYAPLLQMRTALSAHSTNGERRKLDTIWWTKILETNNHNGMQFVKSPVTRFQGLFFSPGKGYLVFSEPALESMSPRPIWTTGGNRREQPIYTRIARICTDDPGLQMPNDGRVILTSFFKTRLVCQLVLSLGNKTNKHSYYGYQPSVIEFNHLVVMTQGWKSSDDGKSSILYGLFSSSDPNWSKWMSNSLMKDYISLSPLALCAYHVSSIDRVIHSSDLIRSVPVPRSFVSHARNRQAGFPGPIPGVISNQELRPQFQRIYRRSNKELENLTQCPGPSLSNRRLAIKAPLLTDSVYPQGQNALGLIQAHAGISAMAVDPRYTECSTENYTIPSDAEKRRKTDSYFTIFYVGTGRGELFKMIAFSGMDPNSEEIWSKKLGVANFVTAGKVHTIGQLRTDYFSHPIQFILFIQTSRLNVVSVISPDLPPQLDPHGHLDLLLIDEIQLTRVAMNSCSTATNCSECVGLRDPDCYWDQRTHQCNTDTSGVNDIVLGKHSICTHTDQTTTNGATVAPSEAPEDTVLQGLASSQPTKVSPVIRKSSQTVSFFARSIFDWKLASATIIGLGIGVIATYLFVTYCRLAASNKPGRLNSTNTVRQAVGDSRLDTESCQVQYELTSPPQQYYALKPYESCSDLLPTRFLSHPSYHTKLEFLKRHQGKPVDSAKLSTFCLNNDFSAAGSADLESTQPTTERPLEAMA